jgi:hypothetical protein
MNGAGLVCILSDGVKNSSKRKKNYCFFFLILEETKFVF